MQQSRVKVPRRRNSLAGIVAEGNVLVRGEGVFHQSGGTPETGAHTVIYLHGVGGGSSWWLKQVASSAEDGVYSVAVDLPGHGKSQGSAYESVEEYTDWLLALLDTLAVRQEVVLVGACLGGLIAIDFACRFPERLHGVVLCGVPRAGTIHSDRLHSAARGDDLLDYMPSLFSSGVSPALRNQAVRHWLKTRPEVRYAGLRACHSYQGEADLPLLGIPVMAVVGTCDRYVERRGALSWSRGTGVKIAWIEGAGTLCMMENPESFRGSLVTFVEGLEAPELPRELRYASVGGYRRTVPT